MNELEISDSEPPGSRYYQKTTNFYNKNFSGSRLSDWKDWKWQIRNRVTDYKKLGKILCLSEKEKNTMGNLPLAITPYYLSLINPRDLNDPLRKTVVPSSDELIHSEGEEDDPLGEGHQNPVPCIVHRYPDRVLFLSTKFCSTNCRFCTRSRIVGEHVPLSSSQDDWLKGIEYIKNHQEVRDVLISGGDPLTMEDNSLEWLISRIKEIKHVEIIRIGTKIPVVLPQRITSGLVNMLKKYHPIFISIHFTHPNEFSEESEKACTMLADAGIPLGSQTVLLSGVNDDHMILRKLFTGLLKYRVRPYYLYQCDPITGSSHFRTPVKKGIEIIKNLRGFISGYAVPQFIIDSPHGGGKIPILPEYVLGYEGNNLVLRNYEGKIYSYPDIM